MAVFYQIDGGIHYLETRDNLDAAKPLAKVLTSSEFDSLPYISEEGRQGLAFLEPSQSNFAEYYPDFIIGSFAVLNKARPSDDPDCFSFYVDDKRLVFIDDGSVAGNLLGRMARSKMNTPDTTFECLFDFVRTLLDDDIAWMDSLEDSMEDLEEAMLTRHEPVSTEDIMGYRRIAIRASSYYQQLVVMIDQLSDNENKIMTKADSRSFRRMSSLAARLLNRAEVLREYSLQLLEMYQTQIDLKQNSIMQIFTIVTVMFAPLTLITGWFGMNLAVMPGLNWPYMAVTLIVLFVATSVAFLLFFRWKKWL